MADEADMISLLGVAQGCATPLAIFNDSDKKGELFIWLISNSETYYRFDFFRRVFYLWDSPELAHTIFLKFWVSIQLSKQHDTAGPFFQFPVFNRQKLTVFGQKSIIKITYKIQTRKNRLCSDS
jgi:hypothetical protein